MNNRKDLINKLINSGLLWRTSNRSIDKLFENQKLTDHLIKFCNEDIVDCLNIIDQIHTIKPKITLSSLKLSYKIYKTSGKLFIPLYYRTFYGHWQKSSGACSGLIYEYDYLKLKNSLFTCEYMSFEKLNDMIKDSRDVFVSYDNTFSSVGNLVWSELKGEK